MPSFLEIDPPVTKKKIAYSFSLCLIFPMFLAIESSQLLWSCRDVVSIFIGLLPNAGMSLHLQSTAQYRPISPLSRPIGAVKKKLGAGASRQSW